MTSKDITVKIKAKIPDLTLKRIWIFELALAVLLLCLALFFDYRVYRRFAIESAQPGSKVSTQETLVRKTDIEKAAGDVKSNLDFLRKPTFPFVQNPF